MKVLLTGATGFVGSHVAEILCSKGYTVVCNARATSNTRWIKHLPIELVDASLDNKESLKKILNGVEGVVHIAGLTAARNDDEFMRGNRDGTKNLLDAILESNITISKFLHCSSMAAVGPANSLEQPLTEQSPCKPITAYGRSKYAAEEVVLAVKDSLPVTIVRPPAVYGERDSAILSFFQTVNKGIAPLIGFSEKHVSLVHVHDLARGIVEAFESPNTIGKTYFISSDEFYTWENISRETAEILGKKTITLKIPHAVVMTLAAVSEFFGRFSSKPPVFNYEKGTDIIQEYWICSTEAARNDFGYKQQVSLHDGITRTVQWYKENNWL